MLHLAAEAEEIIASTSVVANEKAPGEIVTTADIAVEKHLIKRIKECYPDFNIVSEEFNCAEHLTSDCFVIDPIDGTVNFSGGQFNWGVQIALRRNGKTVAAVIDLPAACEIYFADESGAYKDGRKIHVSDAPSKNAPYTIDGWGKFDKPQVMQNLSSVTKRFRDFGAIAVSFAALASGATAGHIFLKDNPWDVEPGLFIATQAGAKTYRKDGEYVVAANSDEFLSILTDAVEKTL